VVAGVAEQEPGEPASASVRAALVLAREVEEPAAEQVVRVQRCWPRARRWIDHIPCTGAAAERTPAALRNVGRSSDS
jgi:hypothetical protein